MAAAERSAIVRIYANVPRCVKKNKTGVYFRAERYEKSQNGCGRKLRNISGERKILAALAFCWKYRFHSDRKKTELTFDGIAKQALPWVGLPRSYRKRGTSKNTWKKIWKKDTGKRIISAAARCKTHRRFLKWESFSLKFCSF